MNWLRYALILGICVVSYMLFLRWNAFDEATRAAQVTDNTTLPSTFITAEQDADIPAVDELNTNEDGQLPAISDSEQGQAKPIDAKGQLIAVSTDRLDLLIDTVGGDIVRVALPEHKAKLHRDESYELMNRGTQTIYYAQSGLIGPSGTDKSLRDRAVYRSEKTRYTLGDQDELNVDLHYEQDGVTIIKRFHFVRNAYVIDVDYIVHNNSENLWRAAPYGRIVRNRFEVENQVPFGMKPYLGAAITTDEKNYDKVSFSDIDDGTIKIKKTGGWVAMVQHYFISAWIPNPDSANNFELKKDRKNNQYILEFSSPLTSVAPGATTTIATQFYAGPKNIKKLEKIAPHLDLTIDYSWLWFIAKPLFFALDFIHGFVGNWGVAIILLTVLIKAIFFYPSAMSYRSMAKMRKLQPMMAELKERYGDDRQKMSTELMKIYRREKVNPLGGCLPILLQMPVFISLYWVLMESVELRHAPFFLWIQDLSVKDPYFILPLIMGATMFLQQKLNPTPPDPMQAKVMQLMPIFFTVLFLFFPAGLVLYWVVNNSLSIAQQYVITRRIERGDSK